MDDLDTRLLDAWSRVSDELQNKPWALARRMERVSRKELRRPVRAWCVALRASDKRIGAHELRTELNEQCASKGYNHTVTLRGERLQALCKPVRIAWPGVTVKEAAKMLGRDERTIWSWVKKGRFNLERQAKTGKRGMPTHLVNTKGALDPQADDGRGPWEVWGTRWQSLWERIPIDYAQRVQRYARLRTKSGDPLSHPGHFCGWDWRCPGRVLATGQHVVCGRACKKLWLPLPVWTIGDALKGRGGEAGEQMPALEMGRSRFACAKCWGLRFDCFRSEPAEAWNRFVSVISGGLLYGREVPSTGQAGRLGTLETGTIPYCNGLGRHGM